MYYLYVIRNTISGTCYYGITNNIQQRWACHKHRAFRSKRGESKCPLYCAMRSYGEAAFVVECVQEFSSRQEAQEEEVNVIAKCKNENVKTYNLHPGGTGGFSIYEKSPEEVEQWRARQRISRKGKTPALGMRHTEENKKLFSAFGKMRWDIYGRYPVEDIVQLRCVDAMRKYGISKTHYYRLKKQLASNDSK